MKSIKDALICAAKNKENSFKSEYLVHLKVFNENKDYKIINLEPESVFKKEVVEIEYKSGVWPFRRTKIKTRQQDVFDKYKYYIQFDSSQDGHIREEISEKEFEDLKKYFKKAKEEKLLENLNKHCK